MSGCISSQFAPVHSPLISSIVDFVCSSHQAHNNYSSFTVRSPLRSELSVKFFLLWGGGRSFARLWCVVSESANWVCLLLSILSIPFILYFLALGSALCVVLPRCAQFFGRCPESPELALHCQCCILWIPLQRVPPWNNFWR